MKAKFIDEKNIVLDVALWNEEGTEYNLKSEMEEGYLEYVPTPPVILPEDRMPQVYYEVVDNVIYQRWQ